MVLRILSREECLHLLSRRSLGRVASTSGALPAIWPVTYLVRGETVLFATARESPLGRAMDGAIVAFQADAFDLADWRGWSVVGVGPSSVVPACDQLLADLSIPAPWATGEAADQLVQVALTELSGHEVLSAPDQWDSTTEFLLEEVHHGDALRPLP